MPHFPVHHLIAALLLLSLLQFDSVSSRRRPQAEQLQQVPAAAVAPARERRAAHTVGSGARNCAPPFNSDLSHICLLYNVSCSVTPA